MDSPYESTPKVSSPPLFAAAEADALTALTALDALCSVAPYTRCSRLRCATLLAPRPSADVGSDPGYRTARRCSRSRPCAAGVGVPASELAPQPNAHAT